MHESKVTLQIYLLLLFSNIFERPRENMLPIVVIQGGLGNQLFQWFYAHTIETSGQFQIEPLYPKSANSFRDFELSELVDKCSHVEISGRKFLGRGQRQFFHFLDRAWQFETLKPMIERIGYFREDPRKDQPQSYNTSRSRRYAKGYFQLQEKVEMAKVAVCSELVPIIHDILAKMHLKFELPKNYSVLHVRRGDYQSQNFTSVYLGILDDSFFLKWVKDFDVKNIVLLTESVSDVEKLISEVKPILILDRNQTSAWETLAIISGAQNFLGSNSSLSWWGAKLCAMNGGSVWLPSEWSFWKNVNSEDYIFSDCKTQESKWTLQ